MLEGLHCHCRIRMFFSPPGRPLTDREDSRQCCQKEQEYAHKEIAPGFDELPGSGYVPLERQPDQTIEVLLRLVS